MPKLTKKFSEVFEFFRDSQSTSSIVSTQFTTKEVEEIQKIFADPAKSYEQAYAEFEEKIQRKEEALSEEKKRQISLNNDPFVQAIHKAYHDLHSQKFDHHDDLAELREQVEQDERKEQPQKEKSQSSEQNQNTQNQEIDLQFMRNMGVKQLFYGLLSKYERTSPSTKRTQKLFEELTAALNTTIIGSDIDVDLVCLQKMLTLLYQHKISEKLNDKSAEYKLIKALLTAFMFYDHLTEVKYAKLVNILLTMQMPDETKIPADESIVHDVFALRLVTLEVSLDGKNLIPGKSEERAACRDFFKDVAEKNVFKYALVDRQSSLLTAAQFFEKPSYDKEEFAAYQAFIENLAKAMAFYRKTPVEESDCIVSNLLSIGIEHLLKIDQGFAPYDPIAQPINSFLTFLSGVYKKSSLIPQAIFKSAIERLLLHQVAVYPKAKNVDDEIWLHSQFNAIYQKYLELNKVEADQELFRKNFVNCTTKHLLIYSDEAYSAILEDLLKIISEKNYNYMRDQIDLLSMWLGRAGVLKIMTEFKEKEKNSTFIVSKLIEDFRNAEYTSCSPFLRQIAYLHPEVNSLWATPTWREIKEMVEPLVKEGNIKEALVSLLTYSAINYGLGSFPNKEDSAEIYNGQINKKNTHVLVFANKAEGIPEEWRTFTRNSLYLFELFSDPINENDRNLISTITQKINGMSDPFALFEIAKRFANLINLYPETTFNLKQFERCLTDMANGLERRDFYCVDYLIKLAPLFSKNQILFDVLLKVLSEKKLTLSFLKISEPSEINKNIFAFVARAKAVKLKQEMQQVGKVNHDNVQQVIINIYEVLNQQELSISEELLESYLSACQTVEDYRMFIQFLFKPTGLPVLTQTNLEKAAFDYLTKALAKFSVVKDYCAGITDLKRVVHFGRTIKYKKALLINLPIAAEKFSNDIECFWLLDLIGDSIKIPIYENDADSQKQVEIIYSKIATNYLEQLLMEFEKLIPSKELIQKAQMISEKFAKQMESYCLTLNQKKASIDLQIKESKDELLKVSQCSKLYEWYQDFKQEEKKIKKFEQEVNELSERLPLHRAIKQGNLEKVKLLVQEGCHLNPSDTIDKALLSAPLLFAYKLDKTDIVNYLIASGADVNVTDVDGHSLLHLAVFRGDLKMIDQLVAMPNLEVEQSNKHNATPLFLAIFELSIPSERRYDVMRKLVSVGKTKETDLLLHTRSYSNPFNENYLHRAILDQDVVFVKWLSENIVYKYFKDETTLQTAVRFGNIAIVKCLWFKCESTDVEDRINALLTALTRKPETDPDRIAIIDFILGKLDINKIKQNNSEFQLLISCIHNNTCLMKLINKGIDPNAMDKNKDTFLHLAAVAGDLNTIQLLVKEAKISSLHPQNAQGLTPLMRVYKNQKLDEEIKDKIICYLIEETADAKDLFDKRDLDGKNALDFAVKANDLVIVRKLLEIEAQNSAGMKKTVAEVASNTASFLGSLASVVTSFDPYPTEKMDEQKKSISINPAYKIAFQLATSVQMVSYFVENSLVDIQAEGEEFIKKLATNTNISLEEKKNIVLFIVSKLEKRGYDFGLSGYSLARTLAPWLFRERPQALIPRNFDLLELPLKIKCLKRAIEDRDEEMVAAFLEKGVFSQLMNDKEATVEQIQSLRCAIDFNTKESKNFWIQVVSKTKNKKLELANPQGQRLLVALTHQNDSDSIEALNKAGYVSHQYGDGDPENECALAYRLAYEAIHPAQENTASQANVKVTSSSESYQRAEKTYRAVLGAVKNHLFVLSTKSFINMTRMKSVIAKLHFDEADDCRMMIDLIYESNRAENFLLQVPNYRSLMFDIACLSKDKNNLTLAKAIFKHHPFLLTELFRVSGMKLAYDLPLTMIDVCQESIKTLFISFSSQNLTAKYKIEELITSALSSAEDRNKELKILLSEAYVVDSYSKKIESKRSRQLLMDENGLKSDALAKARADNILVHIGHVIEAFGLESLTQLRGAEDQPYLFDYARDEGNRTLYIEIVKICLEKWGIKVPQFTVAPTVLHIPAPLQSSSVSSLSSTSPQSSSSSAALVNSSEGSQQVPLLTNHFYNGGS